MYGAILGDIVGSPYEFDCNNYKAKDFPLFSRCSDFTDDTVMTLAVAKALLSTCGQDDVAIKAALVREMQQLGRASPFYIFPNRSSRDSIAPEVRPKCSQRSCFFIPPSNK